MQNLQHSPDWGLPHATHLPCVSCNNTFNSSELHMHSFLLPFLLHPIDSKQSHWSIASHLLTGFYSLTYIWELQGAGFMIGFKGINWTHKTQKRLQKKQVHIPTVDEGCNFRQTGNQIHCILICGLPVSVQLTQNHQSPKVDTFMFHSWNTNIEVSTK